MSKFVTALTKKTHTLQLNDIEEKRHLATCAALAHINKEDIEDAWLCIMEDAPQSEAVTKFNDYFVAQWLENTCIQFMWNVHGARHRTINLAEAWHKRLNSKMGKRKPKMLQFIDTLKKEAELRTHRSIAYDIELKAILDNYDNMSLAEVLKKLSVMQHF